jgi:hypothetical protein
VSEGSRIIRNLSTYAYNPSELTYDSCVQVLACGKLAALMNSQEWRYET